MSGHAVQLKDKSDDRLLHLSTLGCFRGRCVCLSVRERVREKAARGCSASRGPDNMPGGSQASEAHANDGCSKWTFNAAGELYYYKSYR